MELIDTSAWAQQHHLRIESWFRNSLVAGEIAMCDMVALELLRHESAGTYATVVADLDQLPWIAMNHDDWVRAREIQAQLVVPRRQLHHRIKATDLLIAAAAERASITLVHYDQDFDAIADVTGQATRWLAPRGTLSSGST